MVHKQKIKKEKMEFEGKVIDANKSIFKVDIGNGQHVTCTLSGKIRTNSIRILVDDRVLIEVSEYDTSKGRITVRY